MAIKTHNAIFFDGRSYCSSNEQAAVEIALGISINQSPFTITMQTPGNEINLVRGLLFTEGIFTDPDYNPAIDVVAKNVEGFITAVNVTIPKELLNRDFTGMRSSVSVSSCGICGRLSLDAADGKQIDKHESITASLIPGLFEQISAQQKDFMQSGGTHAAGAFTKEGQLLCMMEDIGRHNAVDKVIGWLIVHKKGLDAEIITVSGRISYEIVNKVKNAGIPFLAAVSAPSSLAIEYAQETGLTLLAFCRQQKFTVYANPQRISFDGFEHNTNEPKLKKHV